MPLHNTLGSLQLAVQFPTIFEFAGLREAGSTAGVCVCVCHNSQLGSCGLYVLQLLDAVFGWYARVLPFLQCSCG